MGGFEVGRVNRAHYWGLIVLFVVAKSLLNSFAGNTAVFVTTLTFMYALLSARFHDFGAPAWLVGVLMAIVYGTAFATGLYIAVTVGPGVTVKTLQDMMQYLPPFAVVMLIAPEPLLVLVAGTIAGHTGPNPYGPPNQGFAGVIPRRANANAREATSAEPAIGRIDGVLTRRTAPMAPDSLPAASPVVRRRPGSPAFGRR